MNFVYVAVTMKQVTIHDMVTQANNIIDQTTTSAKLMFFVIENCENLEISEKLFYLHNS